MSRGPIKLKGIGRIGLGQIFEIELHRIVLNANKNRMQNYESTSFKLGTESKFRV